MSSISPIRTGAMLAAVLAGPPLWSMEKAGLIDSGTAVERGALVAAACAIGSAGILRLISAYRDAASRSHTHAHDSSP